MLNNDQCAEIERKLSSEWEFPLGKFTSRIVHYVMVMLSLFLLTGCESSKTIVHELTEPEANNIIVFLAGRGIEATKVKAETGSAGGQTEALWNVNVSSDKAAEAMAILSANGLPRKRGQTLLSIFAQGSALVPSELEEKIRYESGLGEQIAGVIRKIDGVLEADVQLSFPQADPLNPNAPKQDVTASVYVKHTGVLDDPNTQLIPKIRRLVASSIQGLKYDNVTVIPDRARFSDIPRQAFKTSEEKEYVSIWTIIIAKESASRFRVFFFSFLVLIVLLILGIVWMVWKFYPLMAKMGTQILFNMNPLTPEQLGQGPPVEEKKTEEETEGKEEAGANLAGAEGVEEEKTKKPGLPQK